MFFLVLAKVSKGGVNTGFHFMLKDFEIKKCFICSSYYNIKQIDSVLPCVCLEIDHRSQSHRRQNVVRTSVIHSAVASCATFFVRTTF